MDVQEGMRKGSTHLQGGRGNTVIDYAIGDVEVRERVERVRIGDRIDSDHHPVKMWIKDRGGKERGRKNEEKEWRGIWDEEDKKEFQRLMGGMEFGDSSIEEQWREMKRSIRESLEEVESKRIKGKGRKVGWWDGESREAKRKVRKRLREWRKKGEGEKEYREKKKEYKELCERKKREINEEWEKKIREVSRENEVWEIVNRERR